MVGIQSPTYACTKSKIYINKDKNKRQNTFIVEFIANQCLTLIPHMSPISIETLIVNQKREVISGSSSLNANQSIVTCYQFFFSGLFIEFHLIKLILAFTTDILFHPDLPHSNILSVFVLCVDLSKNPRQIINRHKCVKYVFIV